MDYEYFEVTDAHIKLMRRACVSWNDCEAGAPGIDCKRPYGNSAVAQDMLEILGEQHLVNEDGEIDDATHERMMALHQQTETVLQIVLRTGELKPGRYRARRYYADWAPVEAV